MSFRSPSFERETSPMDPKADGDNSPTPQYEERERHQKEASNARYGIMNPSGIEEQAKRSEGIRSREGSPSYNRDQKYQQDLPTGQRKLEKEEKTPGLEEEDIAESFFKNQSLYLTESQKVEGRKEQFEKKSGSLNQGLDKKRTKEYGIEEPSVDFRKEKDGSSRSPLHYRNEEGSFQRNEKYGETQEENEHHKKDKRKIHEDNAKKAKKERLREMKKKYDDEDEYEQEIKEQMKELSQSRVPEDEKRIVQYLLGRLDEVEVMLLS